MPACLSTIARMSAFDAPSAMRIAISRVRCATRNAISPYKPERGEEDADRADAAGDPRRELLRQQADAPPHRQTIAA